MALNTSDWIVIVASTVQVVVMVVLGVLQLLAMRPKAEPAPTAPPDTSTLKPHFKWFARQAWPFAISLVVGGWFMFSAIFSEGEVTRSFVLYLVFGTLLLSFSILATISCLVIAVVFRPIALIFNRSTANKNGVGSNET